MDKNVKFAYTVSAKKFTNKIAELLEANIDDSSYHLHVEDAARELRNDNYELFFAYLANARSDLELLLLNLNDAEDNVRGFLDIGQQEPEPPQKEAVSTETKVEVMQPAADPFAQLQQLQSLVNTIKDLKPKEQFDSTPLPYYTGRWVRVRTHTYRRTMTKDETKSAIDKLTEYLTSKGVTVKFNSEGENAYFPEPNIIAVNTRQNMKSRYYSLLHETGHYLLRQQNDFSTKYLLDHSFSSKSKDRRIDVLREEVAAWDKAYEFVKQNEYPIEKDKWDFYSKKFIYQYALWVISPARFTDD